MLRRIAIWLALLAWLLAVNPGWADETMERIAATGVLRVGFRDDAIPFAYLDPQSGKHIGFSVDMADMLAEYLSKRLDRQVVFQPLSVQSKMRIPMIVDQVIDVEMGASTYTQERE
jgi:ABC-type amino acid transport substrate-binding protein